MDSKPGELKPACTCSIRGRRSVLKLALAVMGVLLAVMILFLALPSKPESNMVWLTQSQMASATQTAPLTRLKYWFMNLTAPLWRRYWKTRAQILVDASLLKLPTWIWKVRRGIVERASRLDSRRRCGETGEQHRGGYRQCPPCQCDPACALT
jgi:hypothetical protein